MVAWDTICRPTRFGGLGVKNLHLQAVALRVRWEWLRRMAPERPWQGLGMMVDDQARMVFNSLVKISVGAGSKVLFWKDRWIHGAAIVDIAPLLIELVSTRNKNCRTVQQSLANNAWTYDIQGELSFMAHIQVYQLCQAITTVDRADSEPDRFEWPCDVSGTYTARSVYSRLCLGLVTSPTAAGIWRSWAPLKCKIFMWLAVQHRLWTSNRRARHGLQDNPSPCYTCLQEEDDVDHILAHCVYAREVWHRCFDLLHINIQCPTQDTSFIDWWLTQRRRLRGKLRRGLDTLIIGISWALWKQRTHGCSTTSPDKKHPPNS